MSNINIILPKVSIIVHNFEFCRLNEVKFGCYRIYNDFFSSVQVTFEQVEPSYNFSKRYSLILSVEI